MAAAIEAVEPTVWIPVYVGLGSNLDDPVGQVTRALQELHALDGALFVTASHLYKNPPMGPRDQPDYVNAVAGLLTRLAPRALLESLQALEDSLGRVRSAGDRWGPRVIDLDLLVYGRTVLTEPGLNLPHSGISERNFVLLPLCDIAPLLHVPGQGIVKTLAQQFDDGGLERIDA
jgi:2-amino-4-hydroxy-6-hydroxymethyldihydropteridine diphosphokinase